MSSSLQTPAATKRARAADDEDAASAAPTRKARRVEAECSAVEAGSSSAASAPLSATLSVLISQLRAREASGHALDQSERELCSTAIIAMGGLLHSEEKKDEAPPPDETLLSFDLLVHTLTFCSPDGLTKAAAVSRHFYRAVPQAVRQQLERLQKAPWTRKLCNCSAPLHGQCAGCYIKVLAQTEEERKRMPGLLTQLGQGGQAASGAADELNDMQSHVLCSFADLLWAKVQELTPSADADNSRLHRARTQLLRCLMLAGLPQDELAKNEKIVADYLERATTQGRSPLGGLFLMKVMPAFVIMKRIELVMRWLSDENMDYAEEALQSLQRLSPQQLASLNVKDEIAAAPIASSKKKDTGFDNLLANRTHREVVSLLLRSIPE